MRPALLGALLGALVLVPAPASAAGTIRLFALVVGYNGTPTGADAHGLAPLRFADDDAARVHAFAKALGASSRLLSVFDRETAARFPGLVAEARPPTRADLRAAVAALAGEVAAAARAGDRPSVLIYYSGHGTRADDGRGTLTLYDGELTQEALYEQVLAPLDGHPTHLLLDACHAEATVRPRDRQATLVDVPPELAADHFARTTLARFPRAGAVMASAGDAQAHEWDVYQGGVFTHELLSALRGGADVNGDGLIEYSEVAAFLTAANGAVAAPQARLRTVVQPPPANPRAALVSLRGVRGAGWLEGRPGALRGVYVEDLRGERLADMRLELGFKVALLLPADVALYVRTSQAEAELRLRPDQRVDFGQLAFRASPSRARGALDSALRHGLFATAFGPSYYQGFIDHQDGLVAVETAVVDLAGEAPVRPPPERASRVPAWLALGAAGALAVAAGTFGAATWRARGDYNATQIESEAHQAQERYDRHRKTTIGLGVGAAVSAGLGWWLWPPEPLR